MSYYVSLTYIDGFASQPPNFVQTYRAHDRIYVEWSPSNITAMQDWIGYQLSITLHEQDGVSYANIPLEVTVTNVIPLSVLEYQFLSLEPNSKYEISVYGVNKNGNGLKTTISKFFLHCFFLNVKHFFIHCQELFYSTITLFNFLNSCFDL